MALMYGGTFLGGGRRVRRGGALGDEDTPTAKKKYVITKKPSKKQIEELAQLQRQIDVEDTDAPAQEVKPKKPRAKPTTESLQKRSDAKARREMLKIRKEAIDNYNNVLTQDDVDKMPKDEYDAMRKMIYDDRVHKGLNLRNRILGHNAYTDAKGREYKESKNFYGPDERMSDADKNDLSMWLYDRGYGNGGAILTGGAILQEGGVPMGGRRRKGGVPLGGVPLGGVPMGGRRRKGGVPLGGVPLGGVPLGGVFMGGRHRRGGVPMGGAWYDDLWDGIKSVASTVLPILL
jgi:hypothetical protein